MNAAAAAIVIAFLATPAPTAGDPLKAGLKWLAAQHK